MRTKEAEVVRAYLRMVEHDHRGRPPVPVEELDRRIAQASSTIVRLALIQQKLDAQGRAFNRDAVEAITEAFVEYAPLYGQRHGISYAAWRECGVPAAVLTRAGIHHRRNGHGRE